MQQEVLIAERYRLTRMVGSGGMGRVWLARDEMLHRDVAIKQVKLPEWITESERDELRARTMREARTAARLNHPNVVRIYDVVHSEASPWLVMEYVPSRSLQEVLQSTGPVGPARAAEIGLAVLAALRAAHRAGVLHRDVKPHNVLIAYDGRVVLTDFGLAIFDGDGGLTRPGVVMGTPEYVAPERAADGVSTVESDLWSLGATLHAAVQGRSPYARRTSMATLAALATSPPDPAPDAGPLRPVLAGLLRRDPRRRLDAAEVERLLHRALDSARADAPPDGHHTTAPTAPSAVGAAEPNDAPDAPVRKQRRPRGWQVATAVAGLVRRQRRRGWLVAAAVAGLILVAGIGTAVVVDANSDQAANSPVAAKATATPSAGTPSPVAALAFPCTRPVSGAAPVRPAPRPSDEAYALLAGWTWFADPAGFRIAAPVGWNYFKDGAVSCFQQPDGPRVLSVDPSVPPTPQPDQYWRTEERRLTGAGSLPGYAKITIRSVPLYQGAAEWECRWKNAKGVEVHTLRLLINTSANRSYTIAWLTPEFDWTDNLAKLGMIRSSFRPAAP